MTTIEKLNSLLNQLEYRLEQSPLTPNFQNNLRAENLRRIHQLFEKLEINKKHEEFKTIFDYKAMNIAGIALKGEGFAEIRRGTYIQIISISHRVDAQGERITKNLSLGYFGKAEKIETQLKNEIIEFVLRWRQEKSFQQSDHYQKLLSKLS